MLEFYGLRKEFGGVVAVDRLDFVVDRDTVTSVIGPNGAGKTTIFNMVTGFLPPTSGRIVFKNRDINACKQHVIASLGICRTFQSVQIFSEMTVIENVMVGRHLRSKTGLILSCILPPVMRPEEKKIREDARHWLRFVGLDASADILAGSLPLGNQRMLEIARALATEPKLLLLDEPASGLNTRETIAMGELIGNIRALGVTVVLVEHDMELVMGISDHVAVLNFGMLIAEGTPAQIQENPDVITAYLGE
ncbi:MAG: ABC transporter ATP-binding protein [Deltaproteobacteria bacterium]|nr:ABC transporter ATP-binding protein [Deltaproteobacteria bacterium]